MLVAEPTTDAERLHAVRAHLGNAVHHAEEASRVLLEIEGNHARAMADVDSAIMLAADQIRGIGSAMSLGATLGDEEARA